MNSLPKSDALKCLIEGNESVNVRPFGTEPKLNVYFSIASESMKKASKIEAAIADQIKEYIN